MISIGSKITSSNVKIPEIANRTKEFHLLIFKSNILHRSFIVHIMNNHDK